MDRKFIETKKIASRCNNFGYYPEGSFGYYVNYCRKRGIKFLRGSFREYKEAITSRTYKDAIKEKDFYNEAKRRFNVIPKCYGVKVIKVQDYYRIGIILQHIGTTTLEDIVVRDVAKIDPNNTTIAQKILRKILMNRGIYHKDLNTTNIMLYKGRYWVIDFTPDNIEMT